MIGAVRIAALSSFFIHSFSPIGPFSPIHLLALPVLWSLWSAKAHLRAGRAALHGRIVQSLYRRGLMIAVPLNFLPDRTTNRMAIPENPDLGRAVASSGLIAVFASVMWQRLKPRPVQNLT